MSPRTGKEPLRALTNMWVLGPYHAAPEALLCRSWFLPESGDNPARLANPGVIMSLRVQSYVCIMINWAQSQLPGDEQLDAIWHMVQL